MPGASKTRTSRSARRSGSRRTKPCSVATTYPPAERPRTSAATSPTCVRVDRPSWSVTTSPRNMSTYRSTPTAASQKAPSPWKTLGSPSQVPSEPATVHHPSLCRAHAGVVRGEPEDQPRDVGRVDALGQALTTPDVLLGVRGDPVPQLALGHDPAGDDAVDPDALGAELPRKRAREPLDPRLRG